MIRLVLLLALSPFSLAATAELPSAGHYPGGVALVTVNPDAKPRFQGKPLWISGTTAVVPLPLALAAGTHQVIDATGAVDFTITGRSYPEQRIRLNNPKMVTPDPDHLKRIRAESAEQKGWYLTRSATQPRLPMALPIKGPITGAFGRKRFFNDQPRAPHSGVDIAAPSGTEIFSPTDGVVLGIGDYYFNGKTVFVDHGQGLISMFCHLSDFAVSAGQTVTQGALLGYVGATGRATGPHLHWSVSLSNVRVEPALFAPQLASLPR
ncbi:peptidoglycan DD-metalloendopeptidase family protein [Litorivicinus lipolyticus]|uniref:Peptidoglycan DD-metalloendopeptidase family protein n=1 Tax=Litorivicinus lipolyticus TaxID=418701 RepID=A0A5Q2Q9X2_9GAMM|nr:M23 family metallopeptidase [Litorivicinus lipolyticus]QGG79764.1 peptidoglycan DD-metalloendopeptidase family protein [Litorivicinus lipolyticus]